MIKKITDWIRLNLVSILGLIQSVIKVFKEIVTAIVNILFPLIPSLKFQSVVMKIREIINSVDEWIERIKLWILPVLGV